MNPELARWLADHGLLLIFVSVCLVLPNVISQNL